MEKKLRRNLLFCLLGLALGIVLALVGNYFYDRSSTNESCMACHFHPEAADSWKQSYHYNNPSGTKVDCVQCHLPPEGNFAPFKAKAKIGIKDVWSALTKKKEDIDWESKKELEHATRIVYNSSCLECHVNLYPTGISDEGIVAHLYYDENAEKLNLQCISCHLDAGHFNPNYSHSKMTGVPVSSANTEIYTTLAEVTSFENFTETVPGTSAAIRMVAVPGGKFTIGSPSGEQFRAGDEGPQKEIEVSPFFMSEVEITWDQYWAFYGETMSEGRTPPETVYANNARWELDAISGPTPPFGNPDQGWGMGDRPALTMTHYAAETFCEWLSLKTGKKYRLPTEAEWEYAARGGSETPYFFEGSPKQFSERGFWRHFSKPDTALIASSIIYQGNSKGRTAEPTQVRANPFGLKNMNGNVLEYCSDWYAPDAYAQLEDGALDPKGPSEGEEHVVRGGMYADDAADVRSASRRHTEHDAWLRTDPQNPKSIWWYSDIKGVGFRVVCEVPEALKR
jgi:formylglycine-generating enzyme required for sulfatase activity